MFLFITSFTSSQFPDLYKDPVFYGIQWKSVLRVRYGTLFESERIGPSHHKNKSVSQ